MAIHKDQVKGTLKETEGKAQEAFGNLTDSREDEARGLGKQAEGKTQKAVGSVKQKLHEAID